MQNEDHTSIKYLMKELDPAEAVQFEQRMMEDEELLEEVECMRRTLRRLEKLPLQRPPSELTEYIVRKACSRGCSSHWRKWWMQADRSFAKYYAAAALILIGMGLGVLSFQYSEPEEKAINIKQTVTRADISGNTELSDADASTSVLSTQRSDISESALPSGDGIDQFLDTTHFRQKETEPVYLPPLRNRYQQTSSIEFTGANR